MRITLYGAKKPSSIPCFKEYVYTGSPKYEILDTSLFSFGVAVRPI